MPDYGTREDGTKKGSGWLGELKMDNSDKVMTELSIGVNLGGKDVLIPSIVPTLDEEDIKYLKANGKPNDIIIKKAVGHAVGRLIKGENPFKD